MAMGVIIMRWWSVGKSCKLNTDKIEFNEGSVQLVIERTILSISIV